MRKSLLYVTGDAELQRLMTEINRLLDLNLKLSADYNRSQIAMRKMISNISHDLKTPLTVVLGYAEMLNADPNFLQEERTKLLSKIHQKTAKPFLLNQFVVIGPDTLTVSTLGQQSARTLMNALATSFVGLVPLYIGMRKYSVPATIITSVLIVSLLFSNNNGFTLSSIVFIPISFAILGTLVAYAAIRRIEYKDITS
jgi:hypothetical protein